MFDEKQLDQIKFIVAEELRHQQRQKILQSDIPPQTIKKRHIEDVVIVFGLSTDRPDNSDTGVRAYFETDTGTLACWDGTQWLEVTLT